ncbi:MAG TPA: 3-methyl-2-oxobutanoate hydroxymethyltransferase [Candidatus Nitrosotenuis sp.]|jgi:3-methyl-2-oxobutanoate hydroxymethyltransferase|nr:3-methyl-2-oxobutanoate hydroxymethyltransferase [Candidatus Nitrosotenuis sp.]
MSQLTPQSIRALKGQRKISMITCYDTPSARIADQSEVDILLVGDSVAMAVHGHDSTIQASMEMMLLHVSAVRRGSQRKFIVADLPFLIHRLGKHQAVWEAGRLCQAGADAIKIEGLKGHDDVIEYMVESGIPVIGHTGLTPQSAVALGGWKVQGKTPDSAKKIIDEAKQLESLGCFAVVLECIPTPLAQTITESVGVPTIGIGAGKFTDGQVLVWHDMLGIDLDFKPKFVRHYCQLQPVKIQALNDYHQSVVSGNFPSEEEQY